MHRQIYMLHSNDNVTKNVCTTESIIIVMKAF